MIKDVSDIKNRNVKRFIDTIRFDDKLTKKDVANLTGLSFSSASNISNELKAAGIVSEKKSNSSKVGRTPSYISLNSDAFFSICIDLQLAGVVRFAFLDLRNNLLFQDSGDTSKLDTPEAITQATFDLISSAYDHVKDRTPIGIGIAVPAIYDIQDGRLVHSSVSVLEDAPLKKLFQDVFNLPVYVDNIVNLYALSKVTTMKDVENVVCVDISQGVGIGVVTEGNLVRGKNGYGAEVAHIPIGDPKVRCKYCGGYGCIESQLSVSGILKRYSKWDEKSPVKEEWVKFIEALNNDKKLAKLVAEEIGPLTGKLMSILINMFDPEALFLGGFIADLPIEIDKYIEDELHMRCIKSMERGLVPVYDDNDPRNIFIGIGDTVYKEWSPI